MIRRFTVMLWVVLLSCTQMGAKPETSQRLAASFVFTEQSFQAFAEQYLQPVYFERVQSQPAKFLQLLAAVIEQERRNPYLSLLVDKSRVLSENYEPSDLVVLKEYSDLDLAHSGLRLRKLLLADLLEMNAAAAADGVSLLWGSTYRSFAYQRDIFRRYARRDGIDAANQYSARAGQSQHQLSLVIDFAPIRPVFADTAAGQWLFQHALDYGFSLSYPEGQEAITGYIYEPWHYRYVGRPIAVLISRYFDEFQQKFYLFWREAGPELKRHYQVPKNRS